LIPNTREGLIQPDIVVDIKSLQDIRTISIKSLKPCCNVTSSACLYIGAAITMDEIIHSPIVGSHWNILQLGASSMGNAQVRNRATVGGNICTASPAADTAPALYVLGTNVLIKGQAGDRCVSIEDFITGPKKNALKQGEIVTGLLTPQPKEGSYWNFKKLSRRKAGDLSIVSVAVLAEPDAGGYHWRIALGAVAPTPIRAHEAETILNAHLTNKAIDEAAASAYRCCCPIDDIRASSEYRQFMVINLMRSTIQSVIDQMETR
jgi:carbon-monoxide dehydrogenase medium subunit